MLVLLLVRTCWTTVRRWGVLAVASSSQSARAATGSAAPCASLRSAGSRSRRAGDPGYVPLPVCLTVFLYVCLSASVSVCLCVFLSVCLFASVSVCVCLIDCSRCITNGMGCFWMLLWCVCPFWALFLFLSICLSVYLFVFFVCLTACPFMKWRLSVCVTVIFLYHLYYCLCCVFSFSLPECLFVCSIWLSY